MIYAAAKVINSHGAVRGCVALIIVDSMEATTCLPAILMSMLRQGFGTKEIG